MTTGQFLHSPGEGGKSGTPGHCPCCDGKLKRLHTINRFHPPFDILGCIRCGFQLRSTGAGTDGKIGEAGNNGETGETVNDDTGEANLYGEEYYSGRAEYSYRDERVTGHFDDYVHRARLKTIARFIPPPADFLDVGCAFGGLVRAAGDFGYRAQGLDLSAYAVREGRRTGLNLRQGELTTAGLSAGSFDIVTLIEVLEHLPAPREVFARLGEIIRPGGLLVIQTADFQGLQARLAGSSYHYYLPGHLHYYSARTLKRFLRGSGFSSPRLFRPVDFGLLPKLRKSRGSFQGPGDYRKWIRIALYHLLGKIAIGEFALTSSLVVYARRKR